MSKSQQHAARKPATKLPGLRKKMQKQLPLPKTDRTRRAGRG